MLPACSLCIRFPRGAQCPSKDTSVHYIPKISLALSVKDVDIDYPASLVDVNAEVVAAVAAVDVAVTEVVVGDAMGLQHHAHPLIHFQNSVSVLIRR